MVPAGDGHHLIGPKLHVPLGAGSVLVQDDVHDAEELFDALVLAQIFTALHKEWVLFLIVTTDYQALGTPDGGHDFDL